MYTELILIACEGGKVVSDRLSAYEKHNHSNIEKEMQ